MKYGKSIEITFSFEVSQAFDWLSSIFTSDVIELFASFLALVLEGEAASDGRLKRKKNVAGDISL